MKKCLLSLVFIWSAMSVSFAQKLDLIPKPVKIEQQAKSFQIPNDVTFYIDKKLQKNAAYLTSNFYKKTGITAVAHKGTKIKNNAITFLVNEKLKIENDGYLLNVNDKGIVVTGKTVNGALNGFQTLLQICTAKDVKKGTIPYVAIEDYPRFQWRGMMLDVSRQFFDKATVLNYIEWLAAHKLNVFHWHLTDDNGWRIEIKSMPDLTLKGGFRGPGEVLLPSYGSGNKRYGGYYTQEDIKEVVAFAAERGVSVMPEIEIPGHSRAVTASYPEIGCNTTQETKSVQGEVKNVWCVGREENFVILENIIKEVSGLFPFSYIHIAGDEVNTAAWEHCPKCKGVMDKKGYTDAFQLQNYFFRRIEGLIEKYNKKSVGWNEILKGGELSPKTEVIAWQGVSYGIESVKRGFQTIMAPGQYYYFDMAQSANERGHRWAAITDAKRAYSFEPIPAELNLEQQKLIKGVHAALWSEYLDLPTRFVEYQSYPRICTLAETGWSKKEDKNWDDFYGRLTNSHLNRMANMGIAFRDFPPSAVYKSGVITVTPPYPGAVVRFTADGSEPTRTSPLYTAPIVTNNYEQYQFKTFFNESTASPAVKITKPAVISWNTTKSETLTFSQNVTDEVDKNGIYYLTIDPETEASVDGFITSAILYENGKVIGSYTQEKSVRSKPKFRFVIDKYNTKNTYKLDLIVVNTNDRFSAANANLNCSPFQEPAVKVTSSMEANPKFPFTNLEDYNIESYLRTAVPCANGDWILYTFDKPVKASKIEVLTGIPHHPRFIANDGYIEYSYNGVDFEKGDSFDYGNASFAPKKEVKAVRIQIKGTNNEPLIAAQDLRVYP